MTAKQKNIITLMSLLLPSIVTCALFGLIMLVRSGEGAASVDDYERKAVRYVEQKYGETLKPISHNANYHSDKKGHRKAEYVTIQFNGFEVYADDTVICDDRQYDEIKAAIEERYINDDELGSHWSGDWELVFCEVKDKPEFCSVYFDGDTDKFIIEAEVTIHADITYEGYPEMNGDYRQLLTDKLTEINEKFYLTDYHGDDNLDVSFYIHDPTSDLLKMPYKAIDESRIYHEARYEEYMGYIAYAYTGNRSATGGYRPFESEIRVYHPEFFDIDEYTAVSDDLTPIVSENEVNFEPVDLSDNAVFSSVWSDTNSITVRDTGYHIELDRKGIYDIFLRLDRGYYGITEKTVPLAVSYGSNDRKKYLSIGWSGEGITSCDTEDWYYLDDKYLYLYICSFKSEFEDDEWVLAFYDLNVP